MNSIHTWEPGRASSNNLTILIPIGGARQAPQRGSWPTGAPIILDYQILLLSYFRTIKIKANISVILFTKENKLN